MPKKIYFWNISDLIAFTIPTTSLFNAEERPYYLFMRCKIYKTLLKIYQDISLICIARVLYYHILKLVKFDRYHFKCTSKNTFKYLTKLCFTKDPFCYMLILTSGIKKKKSKFSILFLLLYFCLQGKWKPFVIYFRFLFMLSRQFWFHLTVKQVVEINMANRLFYAFFDEFYNTCDIMSLEPTLYEDVFLISCLFYMQ